MRIKILFSLFTISFLLLFASPIHAQTNTPEGITVIPSIMYIDLATDAPEYDLKYINNTRSDINLLLSAQDFNELEESYRINFLEEKDGSNYKYSLASWISFENKDLLLTPGEEKKVKIFIDKDRITRGGHYASILARVVQTNANKQINVNPVLSSLLFVRAATGNEIESGKINTLRPNRELFGFPKSFILRFQNDGNVFVLPYGQIKIYDSFGNEIAKGIINEGSLYSLPESIRRYDIKLNNKTKILLPGFYKAKIDMHYGKDKKEIASTTTFFSQGSFDLIKISLIIILGIIIYILYRKRKNNKKPVSQNPISKKNPKAKKT